MSLLSDADKLAVLAAVKSATDTFMVTPVTYYQSAPTIDRYEEDNESENFVPKNLSGLVESPKSEEVKEAMEGSVDMMDVMVTFNVEDLITAELIDTQTNNHKIVAEKDYFKAKGVTYKITDVYFDGPLQDQNVLLVIEGKITQKKINV